MNKNLLKVYCSCFCTIWYFKW